MAKIADEFAEIDPRNLGEEGMKKLGFTQKPLMKVIRHKCLECAGTSTEVLGCTSGSCALWPYRTGRNPFNKRKGNPEAAKHLKQYHKNKKNKPNKRVRVRVRINKE
jgi:hypothetical protein